MELYIAMLECTRRRLRRELALSLSLRPPEEEYNLGLMVAEPEGVELSKAARYDAVVRLILLFSAARKRKEALGTRDKDVPRLIGHAVRLCRYGASLKVKQYLKIHLQ
jgi:hypothetical protein